MKRLLTILTVCLAAVGCATKPAPKDYAAFNAENPRSILVVPVLNNTVSVGADEWFLSTVSRPFAERGYYVFPAHMVREVMEQDGLADASLVHKTDARRLERIFGCDAVLFISIERWESKYIVLSTSTNVSFDYSLRSCKSNAELWATSESLSYTPQAAGSGNPLADLIAQAVISAIEKGKPNYIPLAQQANALAAATPDQGLPPGPYLLEMAQ